MASYPKVSHWFLNCAGLRDLTPTIHQELRFICSISGSGVGSLPSVGNRVTLANRDPYEARGHIVDPFARSDPQQIGPHLFEEHLDPDVYGAGRVAVRSC